ncbi:hypothetical protein V5799_023649 [Amblyomma americanum]|uniref:Uncharacterized protein n=1 Tax=Amblyomma americanum TaxID=6943 RepID=A0AAQ4FGW9_AMBAM
MSDDESPAHEDILRLLQVESVVKRVPSSLNKVRRIVQYAKDPDDDGSVQDPLSATPPEAVIVWALLLVTALALLILLAYYVRKGSGVGPAPGAMLLPTRGSEETVIELDFDDAQAKTNILQDVMKTLKAINE